MRIWRSEAEFDLASCVAVLGTFDGVHAGHQALIRRGMDLAKKLEAACIVYTFDRHPLSLLHPEYAPEALLSEAEKLSKLEQMGVDGVLLEPFTREFAAIEPDAYLRNLVEKLGAKGIVAGFNYSFGAGGRGNAALIQSEAIRLGYRAEIVEAVMDGADVVSSTLLRELKAQSDFERFDRLMKLGQAR